jgi:hypothetical protein
VVSVSTTVSSPSEPNSSKTSTPPTVFEPRSTAQVIAGLKGEPPKPKPFST